MEDFLFTDPTNFVQVENLYDYAFRNRQDIKVCGESLDQEEMVGSFFVDIGEVRFYVCPYWLMYINCDYEGRLPQQQQLAISDSDGDYSALDFEFDGKNMLASELWAAYAAKCSQIIRDYQKVSA